MAMETRQVLAFRSVDRPAICEAQLIFRYRAFVRWKVLPSGFVGLRVNESSRILFWPPTRMRVDSEKIVGITHRRNFEQPRHCGLLSGCHIPILNYSFFNVRSMLRFSSRARMSRRLSSFFLPRAMAR